MSTTVERRPEVKPAAELASASRAEQEARRPIVEPVAMEAPDATLMNRPNTQALPLPPEAPQPMSADNGQAVARAMQMLVTVNVQTTQALVLTELKAPTPQDVKQHDHRREHRSATGRHRLHVDPDEEKSPDQQNAPPDDAQDQDEQGAILQLLELLERTEPLSAATAERVNRFLQSGAKALATLPPKRLRVPVRI